MHDFGTVLEGVIPVFFILVAGVFLRRLNWMTEEADQSMLRVTVNVLAPALIFNSVLHNEALKQIGTVMLAPFVGFCTVALGIGVGLLSGRLTGLEQRRAICTFALCVGLYNYGYIPIPLVTSLFGSDTLGVLFAHNLGVEVALWTLGLMVVGSGHSQSSWRNLLNVPVITIFVALGINLAGLDVWIPKVLMLTANMLGQCAVPMGLILVGATMADHLHEFHSASGWRVIFSSCVLRMGLMPILFLLVAKFLPCSVELKRVIIIQGAMPAATFGIIMARHYGGDAPTAVRIVIATSVVSILTIPLWIRFGLKLVGG